MKRLLIIVLLFISASVWAQTQFESYTWNTIPAQKQSDTIKSVDGTVVLLERRITDVYLNEKKDVFEEIYVFHKKIKVESHKAVDEQNKIYIPVKDVIEIVKIEARFISPTGKITNLKSESIKAVENLENKGDFKTFVIEGAEVGGQVEYYYILRRNMDPHGGIYIQDDVPKGDVVIIFTYPSKLVFLTKSYNNFPGFVFTSDEKGKSTLRANAGYIPALRSERYAYYKANLMRYEYTLAYNTYVGSLRAYSWNKACATVYSNLIPLKKNEKSATENWIKKIKVPDADPATRVRYIENKVKSEISISEDIHQEMDLEDVLKLKQSSKYNAVRLFVALLQAANINFEVVLTSDMETHPFDPEFNCYNYLDNYLIYIPAINAYITPDDPSYRIGLIPSNNQGGYGIFMHPISYNEKLNTMAYDIRQIPSATCFQNTDSLYQVINVDLEKADLNVKSRRAFYGDIGRNFQSFWHEITNERKEEILGIVFNMGSENTRINSYTVSNELPEDIGVKPITWDLDITASALVENAGDDIIIKIGETIGTQSELYEPTTRKLPIKIDVLRNYYRKIIFNIPAGYTVTNPSDLNMHVEMLNNGKTGCIFTSDAEIVNNQLIIISKEYYADSEYPVSRYEEFRKVINASADYNKKTLLLKKK
jgi:hypothetical protein